MAENPTVNLTAQKLARLEQMLERQDIHDCLLRFGRGMDRFDRDLFLSAFHADAVIDAGVFVGGPVDLYAWASAMHQQGQIYTHHNHLNFFCEVNGDTAHTETYYFFTARNRDDSNWIAAGRYVDRLERRQGAWKIALRCNAVEWSGAVPSMPLPFGDLPNRYGNGAPSRDKTDLSYRRPLTNRLPMRKPE
jgi:hypothetical protein